MTIDIVDLPIKMEMFHSYVSLPEGNPITDNGDWLDSWGIQCLPRSQHHSKWATALHGLSSYHESGACGPWSIAHSNASPFLASASCSSAVHDHLRPIDCSLIPKKMRIYRTSPAYTYNLTWYGWLGLLTTPQTLFRGNLLSIAKTWPCRTPLPATLL